MRRSYRFRVRMSPGTRRNAERVLALCCELYNAAVEERVQAWRRHGVGLSYYDQTAQMPEIRRARADVAATDAQVLRDVLRRVQRAFDGFFRRVKAGQKPGHHRFKSRSRYDSVTFQQTGWRLDGRCLALRGIGTLRLYLSREIQGDIKTVTLRRDACGDWFATFSCDNVPERPLPATGAAAGLDVGITAFVATSDGETVENPRPYVTAQHKLGKAQRRRSKMKRGGSNYRKHSRSIARLHRKVARQRRDFHFKTAVQLVRRYDLIAVEDLNVRGLARMRLSKHVHDAGWDQFIAILTSKAEEAGRQVVAVDPRGTSQVCSGCGCMPEKRKTLSVRTHHCDDCGLTLDRDVNAARNILTAGAQRVASRPACQAAA